MFTNRKEEDKVERKFSSAAEDAWNRTGYDYSSLWRMYDAVVSSVRKQGVESPMAR